MQILSLIIVMVCSIVIGFIVGRETTKIEFGRMLLILKAAGLLKEINQDIDDEEDFKRKE